MPSLNWIGKDAVVKHHKDVPFRLLEPVPDLSVGDAASGNLIVQGDNLHALKALLPRYAGQVKCIYIDPPYNTGNEGWAYNDNVNSPEIAKNVTAERCKRVSHGYTNAKGDAVPGLSPEGGGFQFCTLSSEPLFTPQGQIRDDVTFAQLAEFVWFAETGTGYVAEPGSGPFLGTHEGRAIYLLYNGILKDKSVGGGNVLTGAVFDILPRFDGPKTIYAAACRLGAPRLQREQIAFKQTPYALAV